MKTLKSYIVGLVVGVAVTYVPIGHSDPAKLPPPPACCADHAIAGLMYLVFFQ